MKGAKLFFPEAAGSNPPMLRRNVLIFHTGALGDFVMSWPLALAVGRVFAQSRVIYVTHGQKGRLAETALRVESADIESGWQVLWNESPKLAETHVRCLNTAAIVFSFVSSDDDLWARNVRLLAPQAQLVTLQTRPPAGYSGHASQYLLEQLSAQVVVATAIEQMLRSIADRGVGAARNDRHAIIIHPGSGSPKKNWPLERYIALAEQLKSDGFEVRATLGEVEQERWSEDEISRLKRVATVLQPPTYLDLWKELVSAKAVITNDTGPAHLAGMIGVPTLVLYRSTDPRVWKPLGPRVQAIESSGSDGPALADVMKNLRSVL